jgi:dienelactone hydrolase
MEIVERTLSEPWEGVLAGPAGDSAIGVLVLGGSSGRIETDRCRVLAREGRTALSIRWFRGPGQPEGICEIPLETFTGALDFLQAQGATRFGLVGISKGAEATLLTAIRDPRVAAAVALAPTSVVWANIGPGADGVTYPYRSSWTWNGQALPFVPYDDDWVRVGTEGRTAYRTHYEQSRRTFAEAARAAAIPIEESAADIVLVAGGDDQMWPSVAFAEDLATRRTVTLVTAPDAGHRIRLPGESPAGDPGRFDYGGSAQADAALGAHAWPGIVAALRGD